MSLFPILRTDRFANSALLTTSSFTGVFENSMATCKCIAYNYLSTFERFYQKANTSKKDILEDDAMRLGWTVLIHLDEQCRTRSTTQLTTEGLGVR